MYTEEQLFATERRRMVEEQLKGRGITDTAVLAAMNTVPRERFVLSAYRDIAYEDRALPILAGQTISQPYIVAYMLSALQLRPDDRVLEIGTGSGYEAAVLSRIVQEVYTVERHEQLVEYARQRLAQLGYDNVWIRHGDGTLGWSEHAPFDAIIASAGGPFVPPSLLQQLAINGRLVMPVGQHTHYQRLVRYTKDNSKAFKVESLGQVAFVPLIGSEGWSGERCRYEELAHTADIGIRVRARSPAALFACAAEAMFKLTGAIVDEESIATPRFVTVESLDVESLLVDWLNELLYQYEIQGEIYIHCRITSWEPTRLEAIIHGCRPIEPSVVHIKAVTYHQLQLTEKEDGWTAEIFFDI